VITSVIATSIGELAMVVYVEGHGLNSELTTFVPQRQHLHFYADGEKDADAIVTLYAQIQHGRLPAMEVVSGKEVPNYTLTALTTEEYGYSMALAQAGLKVRYVGDDPELFNGMLLCGRQGAGRCSREAVESRGYHDCDGLLGILRNETDIYMMTCRGDMLGATRAAKPKGEAGEYFKEVDAHAARFMALTRSDPAEAWRQLTTLGDHRDAAAVANQERLIMLYNTDSGIQRWADRYGALVHLRSHRLLEFYRMYRSRLRDGSVSGWTEEREIKDAVDAAEGYLADLDSRVTAWRAGGIDAHTGEPGAFWAGLDAQDRKDIIGIDDTFRDKLIVGYFEPGRVSPAPAAQRAPDWAAALEHSIAVLAALEVGDEHAWIKYDEDGHVLVDTRSRQAAEDAASDDVYRFHVEYRKIDEGSLGGDLKVLSKDGADLQVSVYDEIADDPGFQAALDTINEAAAGRVNVTATGGFRMSW
jgi:hypothetical protein